MDEFHVVKLKKGTEIYGLWDYPTSWYTTPECVEKSGYNIVTLNEGLQVRPHETKGYRTQVAKYLVLQDQYVATGIVRNNIVYGSGGYTQYFIPNFSDLLDLKEIFDLH